MRDAEKFGSRQIFVYSRMAGGGGTPDSSQWLSAPVGDRGVTLSR